MARKKGKTWQLDDKSVGEMQPGNLACMFACSQSSERVISSAIDHLPIPTSYCDNCKPTWWMQMMPCNESTEPFNHDFSTRDRNHPKTHPKPTRRGGLSPPRAQNCTAPLYSRDLHSPAAAQRRPKCVAGLLRGSRITQDASGLFPSQSHVKTM